MIGWTVETLVATTALMLLVLAIRAPVRARFGPQLAYALWAIPLARMVLPPLPGEWRERAVEPLSDLGGEVPMAMLAPLVLPVDPIALDPLPLSLAEQAAPWLIVGWAVGAVGFIGYHLIAHALFVARVLRGARSQTVLAAGSVRVVETDATSGPLAFGIWRKTIAFPRDFSERYDEQERALALAHELGHHARGDLIANWAALTVLALHWFNPVAWRAFRAFRADQEMACDALVLAGRPQSLRHAYGRAIVKSAHGGAVSAACHLHTINDVKGRLKMLTKHEKTPKARLLAGGIALAGLATAGLALTASGTAAAEKMRDGVEQATGVELAAIELAAIELPAVIAPLAPTAPSSPAIPVPPVPGQVADAPLPPSAVPEAPQPPAPPSPPEAPEDAKPVESWTWSSTTRTDDGREKRRVFIQRGQGSGPDGKPRVFFVPPTTGDTAALDAEMLAVRREKCGADKKGTAEIIRNERDGKRQVMVICTDRIDTMAAKSLKHAELAMADGERARIMALTGLSTAMMGLRHARETIAEQDSLSPEQKREALAGIDQAIREIEQEQRSPE